MIRISLAAAALVLFVIVGLGACNGNDDDLSGSDSGPCSTCSDIYTNGGIVCGPSASSDAWRVLADCACGKGICNPSCVASFCASMPADQNCGDCLATSCVAEVAGCAQN